MKRELQRVDRMTTAPIIGRFYLVPTVFGKWNEAFAHWPVIGPEHNDIDFFNFQWSHYHVDARFLNAKQRRSAIGWNPSKSDERRLARACIGSPLQSNGHCNSYGLPKPHLLRKRCNIGAPLPGDDVTGALTWLNMCNSFKGRVCERGKRGFVCPHQNAALGSVAVIDGVITCPLHGLRIDAVTGTVLPPPNKLRSANCTWPISTAAVQVHNSR